MAKIVQFPLQRNAEGSVRRSNGECIVSSLDEYRKEKALRLAYEAITCRDGEECRKKLTEAFSLGLSPNSTDSRGWTLLYLAVWKSNLAAMEVIVSAGGSVNKQVDSELGKDTPLCLACEIEDLEAIDFLLKNGADPTIPREDERGRKEYPHNILEREAFYSSSEEIEEFVKKLRAS